MSAKTNLAEVAHIPAERDHTAPEKPKKSRRRRRLYTKAAKRGRASRRKGAEGELEFVSLAHEVGFAKAERSAPMQAGRGDDDHADLAGVGRLWAECKRHRRVNVQREMRVLLSKDRPGFIRVLLHRDDNGPALATLEASELLKLERDALKYRPTIASALRADEENAS